MKMKQKFLLTVLLIFMLFAGAQLKAQSNWEAGLRLGDNFSADLTIPLAAKPRLHTAVYFDRFGVGGYFDWMFALSGGPTGLKFYPGVGPELWFGNDFDFDIAGDFGVEYSFKFPLTIGFDWRPGFRVTDGFKWKSGNWGFIARFRFAKGPKFEKAN
jgi:hypothetical protein